MSGEWRGDGRGCGEEFDGGVIRRKKGVLCGGEFEGLVVGCRGRLDEDGSVEWTGADLGDQTR